ncbi:MAG: leucine-rich repeat domain-containing protein [Prevotella sp.]|nr:leucine-rich repeat domain-containing protein [Prevotella sp.]
MKQIHKRLVLLAIILLSIQSINAQEYYFYVDSEEGVPVRYYPQKLQVNNKYAFVIGAVWEDTKGEITIPETVYDEKTSKRDCIVNGIYENAFMGCRELTAIHIPKTVKGILYQAFLNCKKINDFVLPDSLLCLYGNAFDGTGWLERQPEGPVVMGDWVLGYKGELPADGVVSLAKYGKKLAADSFLETNITEVTDMDQLQEICSRAFFNSKLSKAELKDGVILQEWAFNSCQELKSVHIKGNVKGLNCEREPGDIAHEIYFDYKIVPGIPNYAFGLCTSLDDVIIDEGVEQIGMGAFGSCAMKTLRLPSTMKIVGESAFSCCRSLEEIDLPIGLEEIGRSAFSFSGLKSIDVPEGIETIENSTFIYCADLESVVLPNSLKKIYSNAFVGCESLKTVTLPEDVQLVGDSVFTKNGTNFEIIVRSRTPKAIRNGAFDQNNYDNATLKVPYGTKEIYENTNGWKNFVHIVEMEPTAIKAVDISKRKNSRIIYDLQGRNIGKDLNRLPKGIYIKDGKKIVR